METESAPQKSQSANVLDLTGDYLAEKSKLRKSFGRKEVLFFSVCSVIGLDTIGVVAAAGPEAISWMAVLAIVFLIPASMVIAELSSAFTAQGGPYLWVRLAFGRLAGSITGGLVGGSGGYEAYERITNGGFVSGDAQWDVTYGGWTISAGVARTTEGAGGESLAQSFTVIPSGRIAVLEFDVIGNTSVQNLRCYLTYGGAIVQTVITTTATTGTLSVPFTTTANSDGIRFIVLEDAGVTTIDNISLVA